MNVKSVIVISAVVAAVALSACRREEHVPMKLGAGADLPVANTGSALKHPARKRPTEKTMKGAIVLAAVIAAVALGACRKDVAHGPMKLGASVEQVAR